MTSPSITIHVLFRLLLRLISHQVLEFEPFSWYDLLVRRLVHKNIVKVLITNSLTCFAGITNKLCMTLYYVIASCTIRSCTGSMHGQRQAFEWNLFLSIIPIHCSNRETQRQVMMVKFLSLESAEREMFSEEMLVSGLLCG